MDKDETEERKGHKADKSLVLADLAALVLKTVQL